MKLKILTKVVHISFIPIVFAIGIITANALASLFGFHFKLVPIYLLIALILILINFSKPYVPVFLLAFLAGGLTANLRLTPVIEAQQLFVALQGQNIVLSGHIYEDPDLDANNVTLYLNKIQIEDQAYEATLYVKLHSKEVFMRDQLVTLRGQLEPGFANFSSKISQPEIISIKNPSFTNPALIMRDFFSEKIKQHIISPESSLALGYLLGQKKSLPDKIEESLRIVGLTHIVVASGYNLYILASSMRKIFAKFSRFATLLFSSALLFIFMSMVGFSPSMTRAGIVAITGLFAWYFGRKFHPLKLIILIASITLMINPSYINNLAWLLSFASFTGIMGFAPICTKFFYADKKPNFLSSTLIETISAQVFCLPLILYTFGTFSVISIFANIIVLPTIPLVMLLSFLTGLSFWLAPVAKLTGFIAGQLLSFHIWLAESLGQIPWAAADFSAGRAQIFLLYIPLLALSYYFYKASKFRFH